MTCVINFVDKLSNSQLELLAKSGLLTKICQLFDKSETTDELVLKILCALINKFDYELTAKQMDSQSIEAICQKRIKSKETSVSFNEWFKLDALTKIWKRQHKHLIPIEISDLLSVLHL